MTCVRYRFAVYRRIIECVAGDDLGGEVGAAVAECISGVSVELGLIACERNIFYIGHSEILVGTESGVVAVFEVCRSTDAGESVDYQDGSLISGCLAQGESLRRECETTLIEGNYAETVNLVVGYLEVVMSLGCLSDLVEAQFTLIACENHVFVRHCCLFERIRRGLPA